jgi:hypothetical protein
MSTTAVVEVLSLLAVTTSIHKRRESLAPKSPHWYLDSKAICNSVACGTAAAVCGGQNWG